MQATQFILSIISLILLISTIICGIWIKKNSDVLEITGSIKFHMWLGIAAVISQLIAIIITIVG